MKWPVRGQQIDGQTTEFPKRIVEPAPQGLPTPTVNDMGANKTIEQWDSWLQAMKARHGNGNGHGKSLSIEALKISGR